MRSLSLAALALVILPLSSCVNHDNDEVKNKPVGPKSTESQLPWNLPIAGQGGGMLSAMPKTPRR